MKFTVALIAMAATTLANPLPATDLVARADIKGGPCKDNKKRWCPDKKGKNDKVKILVSEKRMQYGTVFAANIMDSVLKNCNGKSSCEKTDWELDTKFFNTDTKEFPTIGKVKVNVEQFVGVTNDDWSTEAVLKAMKEALQQASETSKEYEYAKESPSGSSERLGNVKNDKEKIRVITGPTSIHLEIPGGKDKVDVSILIAITAKDTSGEASGAFCEKLVGTASSFAGAINGWLGASLGLAQFGCDWDSS